MRKGPPAPYVWIGRTDRLRPLFLVCAREYRAVARGEVTQHAAPA
jgi:hypothetical protein